jgi:tetratricopeptide (TPR) repeat protein
MKNTAIMTLKQIERIQNKITKIKRALSADKRLWGCYDDSRGLRYLPPALYLRMQDYKGAMRYFNWFHKNFDDDIGYPTFLLEWTITLFKNGKLKDAEKMALKTFFLNTYIIDKFLGKDLLNLNISEHSNWENASLVTDLNYKHSDAELQDFTAWLSKFVISKIFYQYANEFIEIEQRLKTEPVGITRTQLVSRRYSLLDDY